MDLTRRVQELIATTLRLPPGTVAAGAMREDLAAWDSMGHVNLMMALEQEFDVYLEVEDFDRLVSVPAIVAHLSAQGR